MLPYDKAGKLLLSLEAAEGEVKDLSAEEKVIHQVHTSDKESTFCKSLEGTVLSLMQRIA